MFEPSSIRIKYNDKSYECDITFNNLRNYDEKIEKVKKRLIGVLNNISKFFENGAGLSDLDNFVLYIDHVEWENDDDEYDRIQFSWGGPSDELRIRNNGTIEYVWLDWYEGIGIDVSEIELIKEFVDYIDELGVFENSDITEL